MATAFDRIDDRLREWISRQGTDAIASYEAEKNATSIDGLPALSEPESR